MIRTALRRLGWALLALLGLLLIVVLAWVASNVVDAEAKPRPAGLTPPASPAGSPLFFRIQGLLAPATAASAAAKGLATITGAPLQCRAPDDCVPQLVASVAAVETQLQPHALLGERCQELATDLRYEEPLPARMTADTLLPSYQGAMQCELWFKGQALRAAAAGDKDGALRPLQAGAGLGRAMASGSPMLIGRMVAAAMLRSHFDAVLAVATLQPAWAADLAPLAGPLPAAALDPRPWIALESAWVHGTVDDLLARCGSADAPTIFGRDGAAGLGDQACRWRIGFLPEMTRQALDAPWLQLWDEAGQGLDAALDASIARARTPQPEGPTLHWRNTVGQVLVAVSAPEMGTYLARIADVDLHRQALALTLAAAPVPVAERAAWLARQGLPARQRARLGWADGGLRLVVQPWLAELPGNDARRNPFALAVPGA